MYWFFFGSLTALMGLFGLKVYEIQFGQLLFAQSSRENLDYLLGKAYSVITGIFSQVFTRVRGVYKYAAKRCRASVSYILRRLAEKLDGR